MGGVRLMVREKAGALGQGLEELQEITEKYDAEYIKNGFATVDELNRFGLTFFKDVAEIYDCITRIKNTERNPTGYTFDDAPILGLLVRVWKLMKEVIRYYEEDNAEVISVLERPLIEAAVTASFLMGSTSDVMEDYRKCSYKDRLRLVRDMESGSPFLDTKAGKRLLASVREKLALEGLNPSDFEMQKRNRWRVQGKTFHAIFSEVEHADLYACTYGMMSESVHGSWNESLDWCLTRNEDGTFSAYPFFHPADVRFLSPTLRFTNRPFRLWLQRIDAYDENLQAQLDWIDRVNSALFQKFDTLYDGGRE